MADIRTINNQAKRRELFSRDTLSDFASFYNRAMYDNLPADYLISDYLPVDKIIYGIFEENDLDNASRILMRAQTIADPSVLKEQEDEFYLLKTGTELANYVPLAEDHGLVIPPYTADDRYLFSDGENIASIKSNIVREIVPLRIIKSSLSTETAENDYRPLFDFLAKKLKIVVEQQNIVSPTPKVFKRVAKEKVDGRNTKVEYVVASFPKYLTDYNESDRLVLALECAVLKKCYENKVKMDNGPTSTIAKQIMLYKLCEGLNLSNNKGRILFCLQEQLMGNIAKSPASLRDAKALCNKEVETNKTLIDSLIQDFKEIYKTPDYKAYARKLAVHFGFPDNQKEIDLKNYFDKKSTIKCSKLEAYYDECVRNALVNIKNAKKVASKLSASDSYYVSLTDGNTINANSLEGNNITETSNFLYLLRLCLTDNLPGLEGMTVNNDALSYIDDRPISSAKESKADLIINALIMKKRLSYSGSTPVECKNELQTHAKDKSMVLMSDIMRQKLLQGARQYYGIQPIEEWMAKPVSATGITLNTSRKNTCLQAYLRYCALTINKKLEFEAKQEENTL